jgi:carboxyl-terminal processing protease
LQLNERKLGPDLAAQKAIAAVKDVILNEAVSVVSDSVAMNQGGSSVAASGLSTVPVVVMAVPASSPGQ